MPLRFTIDVRREPERRLLVGGLNVQPFCRSLTGVGRPTRIRAYATSYDVGCEWNDTRFKRPDFDAMAAQGPQPELDDGQAPANSTATWR